MQPTATIEPTLGEFDPFAAASNPQPQVYSNELWGMVEINAWACAPIKGVGKVPFNPQDPTHKRFTAIDIFIQPLAELEITNSKICEGHYLGEYGDWPKIVLPSIKAGGFENVREINGKWARIERTPNGKTYVSKDGETKNEMVFKFLAFYDTEEECRAAYLANGGTTFTAPTKNAPAMVVVDALETDRQTALAFLKVIVPNAARGKSYEQARIDVALALAGYPTVNKFFTVDSPEVDALIRQITG